MIPIINTHDPSVANIFHFYTSKSSKIKYMIDKTVDDSQEFSRNTSQEEVPHQNELDIFVRKRRSHRRGTCDNSNMKYLE